jgi:hypothetical protein
MKILLKTLLLALLATVANAQQTSIQSGQGLRSPRSTQSPPITNPEPMTLVALAGGAAVAGGLLRRRRKNA